MPRARPITTSFNAGELSPLLDGRVDQDKYFTGCKTLLNFIPTVQGPARRRGGTRHVGLTKTSSQRAWLADFVFSAGQAYVLEFGDNYVRFWTNRGQLLSGMSPYEIASPYTAADLVTAEGTFALRTLQSSDVMWIVHAEGKYPPYRLSRLGATNWTLVQENFTDGPFRDVNSTATTMQASAVTGNINLAASTPTFLPGHVGSLLLLNSFNPGDVAPWDSAGSYTAGVSEVRNGGNVYQSQTTYSWSANSTQRYVPTHTEGTASDGIVTWLYLHSGYGWARINSVSGDGLTATATVLSRLPQNVVGTTTRRWAFSEFSTVYGWPTGVAFFKERLTYSRGRQVFHSVTGDFASFKRRDAGLVTAETAMSLTLASDKLDSIRWLAQSKTMLIGSARAELSLGEQTTQNVYSATNVQNTPQTEYGSRLLRPLRVGESVLFVERAGHRIRDMKYDFSIDRYKADDVTVLSEHIFDGSEIIGDAEQDQRDIVDWAYQQQRDNIVWCVLSDGRIASMVFNRERGVIAWTPHELGGDAFVEAVQSIPAPDGRTDDTWFIVRRTVNGQVQRAVEYMTDYRLVKKGAAEAVHVDSGVTYRGVATDTITGLGHLEGRLVSVCVDGSNHPDRTVVSGQITLDRPGKLVHVGYRFISRMQSMRLEVQGGGGTSQTARKGIGEIWLRLQSTIGGRVGPSFTRAMDDIKTLDPAKPVGTPPALFSGDYALQFPGGFDTDAYVCYEQDMPLPATLVAIILRVQIND